MLVECLLSPHSFNIAHWTAWQVYAIDIVGVSMRHDLHSICPDSKVRACFQILCIRDIYVSFTTILSVGIIVYVR
jgi:hypothetical protein